MSQACSDRVADSLSTYKKDENAFEKDEKSEKKLCKLKEIDHMTKKPPGIIKPLKFNWHSKSKKLNQTSVCLCIYKIAYVFSPRHVNVAY